MPDQYDYESVIVTMEGLKSSQPGPEWRLRSFTPFQTFNQPQSADYPEGNRVEYVECWVAVWERREVSGE